MKLVKVLWEDAGDMDVGPWVHISEAKPTEAIYFQQVGWLVEHTAEAVVLTSCIGKEQMGIRGRIPLGMVRSMVSLDDGEPVPIRPKRQKKQT